MDYRWQKGLRMIRITIFCNSNNKQRCVQYLSAFSFDAMVVLTRTWISSGECSGKRPWILNFEIRAHEYLIDLPDAYVHVQKLYTSVQVDWTSLYLQTLLKQMSAEGPQASRMSVDTGPFNFHYIIEGPVCYLTLTGA